MPAGTQSTKFLAGFLLLWDLLFRVNKYFKFTGKSKRKELKKRKDSTTLKFKFSHRIFRIWVFQLDFFLSFERSCLGVTWGLPGGFLGVRRGKPHLAPRKPSLMPLCFPFKYRIEASMVYLIEMSKNKKKEFILSTSFIKHMDDTPVLSWQIIFFSQNIRQNCIK